MPERLVIIWRSDPGQLISTVGESKKPRLFDYTDAEVKGLDILSNSDAEKTIRKDTFDRVAVTESFCKNVLGWNV